MMSRTCLFTFFTPLHDLPAHFQKKKLKPSKPIFPLRIRSDEEKQMSVTFQILPAELIDHVAHYLHSTDLLALSTINSY